MLLEIDVSLPTSVTNSVHTAKNIGFAGQYQCNQPPQENIFTGKNALPRTKIAHFLLSCYP